MCACDIYVYIMHNISIYIYIYIYIYMKIYVCVYACEEAFKQDIGSSESLLYSV